jgi:hypothetical protein
MLLTYSMKRFFTVISVLLVIAACQSTPPANLSSLSPVNWEKRKSNHFFLDTLYRSGSSYLSVYSEIYSQSEHRTHKLTATVSMRNMNRIDTLFIEKAEYFNTHGESIRTYFTAPIYIAPLETVEIVIDEVDGEGGTGANFLFDWKAPRGAVAPLFEGVMISTSGQQGLSFTTQGISIK